MNPAFFRKARTRKGASVRVGSQVLTVRIKPEVLLDGQPVTATFDADTLRIEIKEETPQAMRDSLFHELFHATIAVLRLRDRFRGRSAEARRKAEEDIAHLALPVLLGAMDQTGGAP